MRNATAILALLCLAALVSPLSAQVGKWGIPVVVKELSSSGSDYYPFLTGDNLTARVASSRTDIPGSPGGWDVYRARRSNPHALFGTVTREPGAINGSTNDLSPHVMADELTAYAANTGPGGLGFHDVWMFTRSSPAAPWGGATNPKMANSPGNDYCPTVTGDGLELYLSRNVQLVLSTRSSTSAPWGTAAVVPELMPPKAPAVCNMPSISQDGLTMFVCMSGAPGGKGSYDIYAVTRKKRTDPWGVPVHQVGLNSASSDHRPSISPDGRQIFFASSRPSNVPGLRSNNVWMATWTGLTTEGLPRIGQSMKIHLTLPHLPGTSYQVGMAFSSSPGILIRGLGTVPLALDNLLIISAGNMLPVIFKDFTGLLDSHGEATATLNIPGVTALAGVPFSVAAITYDPGRINFITNGKDLEFLP